MAKKVSKASTKKKTTKKSAGSSKKKTAKKPRAATTKKPAAKKKSAKKAAQKKAPAKKTTKKKVVKKTAVKKTTTKKKAAKPAPKKKAPAKKPISKKTVTKKTVTKKTTKKADTKKAPTKKTTKKAGDGKKTAKTAKEAGGSKKKTPKKPASDAPRFRGAFASSHDDGLAAAQRLASAAGLSGLSRASQETTKQKRYKKLTKTPFKADQLSEFREMLRSKRRQLVGDVSSMETEALSAGDFSSHTPNHMADQGSDTYDQSLNLDLAASQRTLLTDIDDALLRIESGTYGICELLGKPIKVERLKHTPWARFSIEAARMIEDDPSILKRSSTDDNDDG